jgi:hypothetical protein
MKKIIPVLFGLAIAVGGLLFVWPTPYVIAEQNGQFIRVNRLTGVVEYGSATGWTNPYAATATAEKPREITGQVELQTATRNEGPVVDSVFRNRSGRDLRLVRIEFSVLDDKGVVVDHGNADLESVRTGDAVKISLTPSQGAWPTGGKLRVDKVTENVPAGLILSSLR